MKTALPALSVVIAARKEPMTGLAMTHPTSSAITSFVAGVGMLLASGCTGSPDRVVESGAQLAIRGVVRNAGTGAPEAGVWVIAETQSLPTPFREIVVTEDEGRFVVPNLPDGSYEVWVRGYGLRDSMPVDALRGDELALTVSTARSPQEAAAIYPASYWLSLYRPPAADQLPDEFVGRSEWIANMKLSCMRCHQFGGRLFHARDAFGAWNAGSHHRQLGYFDTTTEEFVLVDTAYGTNHLQFDREGRLWTSGDAVGVGRFDPSVFDPMAQTETLAAAQTAFVSVDPTSCQSVAGSGYGIAVSPVDGSVWRTNTYIGNSGSPDNSSFVGQNRIIKFDPETSTFTDYELPPPARAPVGIDATTDGRVWFGTASGHLGRFDPVTEQFTYWESPGPKLTGAESETGSADFHYYIFVDQFDTFGLGPDMVILTGSNSDALVIFDPATEQFTVVRVPYPLTMYHRGLWTDGSTIQRSDGRGVACG